MAVRMEHSLKGRRLVALGLAAALICLRPIRAQQPDSSTLQNILQSLQDSLDAYHKSIPSFFCDEHALSKMVPGPRNQNTNTDSTFRVKRATGSSGQPILIESRSVITVDGNAADGRDIGGPAIFVGALSGGPVIVSLGQASCMSYTLEANRASTSVEPYIVNFASLPAKARPSNCVLSEDGFGSALIDPKTMQVTHLEFMVPKHTIYAGGKTTNGYIIPPIMGIWTATIDYVAVSLGEKTFQMPGDIESKMTGGLGPTTWSFQANYSGFHKLEVTSRIMPANDSIAP